MNERGSVTFWVLGLSLAFLSLGVLSVDLWSLMAHRRELAAFADAAATAAAGAVDEAAWRTDQVIRLDRAAGEARARATLAGAGVELPPGWLVFDPEGTTVRVALVREAPTALLALAGRDGTRVAASAEATAVLDE